jgi:methyl-accepting chemotaxis protein
MKFRNSLRVRLLLPVLALVLVVVVASTLVLAVSEAGQIRADATNTIERQSGAMQSLFAVTRSIMLERAKNSMRLLRQEGQAKGEASIGPPIMVAGRQVNDLLFGNSPQGNVFDIVDGVTSIMDGTVSIFSRSGDDFVRISTNVKKDDGSREVGTLLDPTGPVIGEIRKNHKFYDVVDVLGNPRVTGYEPVLDAAQANVIGVWSVGYKTDLQPLDEVISASRVLDSGFVALFDSKGKLRFHSKSNSDINLIDRIAKDPVAAQDWVVVHQDVPGWGFALVSAYPKSDVELIIARQLVWIVAIGVLVCILLLSLQWALIWSRVLRPVQNLTAIADELSMGKSTRAIDEVKLDDEIGVLARAISRLSNSVRVALDRLNKR